MVKPAERRPRRGASRLVSHHDDDSGNGPRKQQLRLYAPRGGLWSTRGHRVLLQLP